MSWRRFWLIFDVIVFASVLGGATATTYLLIYSLPDGVVELNTNDKGEMWPEIIWMSVVTPLGFLRAIYLMLDNFVGGDFWKKLRLRFTFGSSEKIIECSVVKND